MKKDGRTSARSRRGEGRPTARTAPAPEPAATAEAQRRLAAFRAYRQRMNERILGTGNLGYKRMYGLDSAAYRDAALDGRTKELLGLVASLVLRCNDCVDYHLDRAVAVGWSDAEIEDAMNVGLVVGGTIVIPHLRHAMETLDALRAEAGEG